MPHPAESRLEAVIEAIDSKSESLKYTSLFGIWGKQFVDLAMNLFERLDQDVKDFNDLSNDESRKEFAASFAPTLEDILALVDTSSSSILQKGVMHEFISTVLRDLGLAQQIRLLGLLR